MVAIRRRPSAVAGGPSPVPYALHPNLFQLDNQVERWFAFITDQLIRRGDHRSVQALEVRAWVKAWNDDPKPFIWTKTAEQILTSIGRLIQLVTGAGH